MVFAFFKTLFEFYFKSNSRVADQMRWISQLFKAFGMFEMDAGKKFTVFGYQILSDCLPFEKIAPDAFPQNSCIQSLFCFYKLNDISRKDLAGKKV